MAASNLTGDPDLDAVVSGVPAAAPAALATASTGDPDLDAVVSQRASPEPAEVTSTWPNAIKGVGQAAGVMGAGFLKSVTGAANDILPDYPEGSRKKLAAQIEADPILNYRGGPEAQPILNAVGTVAKPIAGALQGIHSGIEQVAGKRTADIVGDLATLAPAARAAPESAAAQSAGLTPAQQQALQQGQALGMKATPGMASGSKPLQQVEATLESHPWTSGPASAIKANNASVLNRSWAKAIGEDSDVVDSTTMGRADDRLGEVFNSVRDARPRSIDPDEFTGRLSKIESDFEGLLPGGGITDHKLVQRLMSYAQNGTATGEQLGGLTSKLGKAASREMTSPGGDRELGQALYQVKDYVDDLVAKGLKPDEAASYNTARQQYRALMQLTSRVGNVNPSTGNVNGASMASYLQKSDRPGFLYGKNQSPPYAATRFAQAFKPIVGDSGTATRSSLSLGNIAALPLSVPANLASRAYYKGMLTPLDGRTLSSVALGTTGLKAPYNDPQE